jgi:hypothetical protein
MYLTFSKIYWALILTKLLLLHERGLRIVTNQLVVQMMNPFGYLVDAFTQLQEVLVILWSVGDPLVYLFKCWFSSGMWELPSVVWNESLRCISTRKCLNIELNILTILDEKSTTSFRNFENNQPHYTLSLIFVFYCLHFIQDCRFRSTLDRNLWKIGDNQQKTCFLQNAQDFLSVYCSKLSWFWL